MGIVDAFTYTDYEGDTLEVAVWGDGVFTFDNATNDRFDVVSVEVPRDVVRQLVQFLEGTLS